MRKIGLYFGSFDPIFNELINLCEEILHEFGLDYILLAPYVASFNRDEQLNAYIEHRKDMIRLATWGNNKIGLAELELETSELKSIAEFSDKIQAKHNAEIYNIMPSHDFLELPSQAGYKEFVRGRNLIVAVQPYFSQGISKLAGQLISENGAHILFSTSNMSGMSSARIRAYIQLDAPCLEHVPPAVLEYINRNFLYRSHSGLFERIRDLEPEPIYDHTVAACLNAIEIAQLMNVNHGIATIAALLHNIGKCYTSDMLKEKGIYVPDSADNCDILSRHGRLGELAAKYFMGITNPQILTAIKYHSTGHPKMSRLTSLIFVSATLAHDYMSDDYKHIKYQLFIEPEKTFLQLLSSKYKRAKLEYSVADFPVALGQAYRYYSDTRKIRALFR